MSTLSPLEADIRRRIKAAGPMPVDEYMGLCLAHPQHGYYITRDPFGARGDFTTAPEISQMFGELIGLWMSATWKQMGSPSQIRVIELGPGRGTLMKDALRAAQVVPAFRQAMVVHLVEISPVLQAQQQRLLEPAAVAVSWHASLKDVPDGPAIIIANEFFDALPVNQSVKTESGWHERRIGIDASDKLFFTTAPEPMRNFELLLREVIREAPVGSLYEWRSDAHAMDIARRIKGQGGAALVIDYGHIKGGPGDTLQAVGQHTYVNPLLAPGAVDLTAHVDFEQLAIAIEAMGAKGYGPLEQGEFLRRLGIETRAQTLKAKANRTVALEIEGAVARLTGTGRDEMGALFKVMSFAHPALGAPPGFDR